MKSKLFLLIIFSVISLPMNAHSQETTRPVYFDTALDAYLAGNIDQAIEILNIALEIEPADTKNIKAFMVKLLMEAGIKSRVEGKFDKANQYFEKAYQIDPNNLTLKELLNLTQSQAKKPIPSKKIVQKADDVQKQQEDMLKMYTKDKTEYKQMIQKFEEERKLLIAELRKQPRTIQFWGIPIQYWLLVMLGVVIAIFISIYFVLQSAHKRSEKILMQKVQEYHEQILQRIQTKEPEQQIIPEPIKENPKDKETRELLKGIGIIAEEMKEEHEIAERLLEEYLHNSNPEIRSYAAEVLYSHNPNRAIAVLMDMAHSLDRVTRITIVPILERMFNPRAMIILTVMLKDSDTEVKQKVFNAVTEIITKQPQWLPEESVNDLKDVIKNIKLKEGWIG